MDQFVRASAVDTRSDSSSDEDSSSGSCAYEPLETRSAVLDGFLVNGRRYRKRLGTTNLRLATRRERELIEEAGHDRLPVDEQEPKRLSEAIDAYLAAKRIRCSANTIELEEERPSIVKKHFGDVPHSAITAATIADFQRARHDGGKPTARSTWMLACCLGC